MKFTKIKHSAAKGQTELHWTTTEHGDDIVHSLVSDNAPEPELPKALASFAEHVVTLLGVGGSWLPSSLTVTGISLNEEDDGRRGIIITCRRELEGSNAPILLNTPHLREPTEGSPLGTPGVFLDYMDDAIAQAEKAAAKYVHGHREQMSIFDAGKDEELEDDGEVEAAKPRRRKKAEV